MGVCLFAIWFAIRQMTGGKPPVSKLIKAFLIGYVSSTLANFVLSSVIAQVVKRVSTRLMGCSCGFWSRLDWRCQLYLPTIS